MSADFEHFIAAVKAEQLSVAVEGLLKPNGREAAFEFGRLSGTMQGLQRALELLESHLNEDTSKKLSPSRSLNPYTS